MQSSQFLVNLFLKQTILWKTKENTQTNNQTKTIKNKNMLPFPVSGVLSKSLPRH